MFVDGAFLGSRQVIELAELSPTERQQRLDEARHTWKHFAGEVKVAVGIYSARCAAIGHFPEQNFRSARPLTMAPHCVQGLEASRRHACALCT